MRCGCLVTPLEIAEEFAVRWQKFYQSGSVCLYLTPPVDSCVIEAVVAEITEENTHDLVRDVDVVVDGQDNWKTRFVINDYCVTRNIPFIHAGVSALHGQLTTIVPGKGPCLRCIFPKNPPEFEGVPVLGATPALLASLQVMETVKLVTGIGKPLVGRMFFANGEEMVFETAEVKRRMECPVCGNL